ncbi:S1 domain-containing RNA-binding protein [Brevibacillus dissolubilis]|uniref:S1 domain-containing RNA-binding protein n=1 Tax=Brevibacillus dissolubilis TaxID=1844116 RepID=UPI001116A72A|nr:S1 domain-containing RNA-binding protein [Brevibacillus dissolubilis]
MEVTIGSKYEGKVTGITKFGAFVELPGGVTGLVHISEVADKYVTDINEHLKIGDMVTVKVMSIQDNKIGLSIKKAVDQPPRPERPARPARDSRPRGDRNDRGPRRPENFEDKISRFLKDSEDRLTSLRKNQDKKGRGR